jgi:hypothetical protein
LIDKQKQKELKKQLVEANKLVRVLTRDLKKVSTRKMRKGGGKPKGGAYEHVVAGKIAEAFKKHGVCAEDSYRTKNSGAGPKAKGDLQFSSVLNVLFPFTVECKHVKKFNVHRLFTDYAEMQKSWLFKQWWEQSQEEIEITQKPGLLVFRANNCPDLCSFESAAVLNYFPSLTKELKREGKIVTKYKVENPIWTMRLDAFLRIVSKTKRIV